MVLKKCCLLTVSTGCVDVVVAVVSEYYFQGVGLIGIMGGIITTCYVIMYPTLLKYGVVLPEASIINTDLIPAVMGIVTLAIFAPILVIWVQTRRWSPLEEYRREQNDYFDKLKNLWKWPKLRHRSG